MTASIHVARRGPQGCRSPPADPSQAHGIHCESDLTQIRNLYTLKVTSFIRAFDSNRSVDTLFTFASGAALSKRSIRAHNPECGVVLARVPATGGGGRRETAPDC